MENNNLYQKIQEINDYVVKEYSYDQHFDFDILEELTVYTVNLVRMGIFDFKLVIAIGEISALYDIANGRYAPVDVREKEEFKAFNKMINDAVQEWYTTHPNETPIVKNLELVPMPGSNSVGPDFDTRHLLKN